MKTKYKRIGWHVFTDNWDDYCSTLTEAKKEYYNLIKNGAENVRLYKCFYDTKTGDFDDEEYYLGQGEWPY